MKYKINKQGILEKSYSKGDQDIFVKQVCVFIQKTYCGDTCPYFGEIKTQRFTADVDYGYSTHRQDFFHRTLKLCVNTIESDAIESQHSQEEEDMMLNELFIDERELQ